MSSDASNPSGELRSMHLSTGPQLSYRVAGDPSLPALLLIHGFPNASGGFRHIMSALAEVAYVIAPDMPGSGASEPLAETSFDAFVDATLELLDHLNVGARFLYVHDWGAPVSLGLALRAPEQVLGLIIQNGNAHESGMDRELWKDARAYWYDPSPEREKNATAHLNAETFVRDQYVTGLPDEIAARIQGEPWKEDWVVLQKPGRLVAQKALILDNGLTHVARFSEYAHWLKRAQPPALMIWGRHDPYFAIDETLDWMKALPRMEAHILDGGHLLLETHAIEVLPLITAFLQRHGHG
jgi:pimeloyl-ACP methyl ester carboxylesterase